MTAVVVVDRLDRRIRSLNELRQVTGLSLVGQVALMPEDQAGVPGSFGMICHAMPRSIWAEAYRGVRTNIDFLRRDSHLQVLLVTSAYAGEGKTTSASNLAISFAAAGRKVLLIDADLRRPSLDRVHGLNNVRGLSHLLRDLMPLRRVVQHSRTDNLDVVTAGPEVPNPAELLLSPRLAGLLDEARGAYDVIVLDSSPLLAVTDPLIIGAVADGIVLTVRAWMLDRRDAERALELLQNLGTPVLGLLVNGLSPGQGGYSHRYGHDDRRSDHASRSTGDADLLPAMVAPPQPQANGRPVSGSHEFHVACTAINGVSIPDEWTTRIWLSRGPDLLDGPSI